MSVARQADAIRESVQEWAEENGGTVLITSNLRDLWAKASQSSQKPCLLICFTGERARGPFGTAAVSHRVDRSWTVAVVRGRGFASTRGDTLTQSVGNADPFYDALESVRDLLRNASELTAEDVVDYKSIRPMQLGTLIIDGYLIEFTTANDLAKVT